MGEKNSQNVCFNCKQMAFAATRPPIAIGPSPRLSWEWQRVVNQTGVSFFLQIRCHQQSKNKLSVMRFLRQHFLTELSSVEIFSQIALFQILFGMLLRDLKKDTREILIPAVPWLGGEAMSEGP